MATITSDQAERVAAEQRAIRSRATLAREARRSLPVSDEQIDRFEDAVRAASAWTGCEWSLEPCSPEQLEEWLAADELPSASFRILDEEARSGESYREAGERLLAGLRRHVAAIERSAAIAAEHGDLAVEALRRGDLSDAVTEIDRACQEEAQWGDCPSWGLARDALAEIGDEIDCTASEQASREAALLLAAPAFPVLADLLASIDRDELPIGIEPGDSGSIDIMAGDESPTAAFARLGGDADPTVRALAQECLSALL